MFLLQNQPCFCNFLKSSHVSTEDWAFLADVRYKLLGVPRWLWLPVSTKQPGLNDLRANGPWMSTCTLQPELPWRLSSRKMHLIDTPKARVLRSTKPSLKVSRGAKQDVLYRFCVDYGTLKAVTVEDSILLSKKHGYWHLRWVDVFINNRRK